MAKVRVKWNEFIRMKKKKFADDYYVVKELGKGGFGTVFKVVNKTGSICRAAKRILKKSLCKKQHESLLAQMAIMMPLDHPNIIKLHEVYDQPNCYVLVLELCEGGDLF